MDVREFVIESLKKDRNYHNYYNSGFANELVKKKKIMIIIIISVPFPWLIKRMTVVDKIKVCS